MFILVVRILEDVPQVIGNEMNLNVFHQEANFSDADAEIYEQETIRRSPLTSQEFEAFFYCQQEQIARYEGLRNAEGNFDWPMQEFSDMQELLHFENNEEHEIEMQEDNEEQEIEMQEDNEDDMEDANINDPNPEEVENIEMGDPWENFESEESSDETSETASILATQGNNNNNNNILILKY